jgi:hypothetical protein
LPKMAYDALPSIFGRLRMIGRSLVVHEGMVRTGVIKSLRTPQRPKAARCRATWGDTPLSSSP